MANLSTLLSAQSNLVTDQDLAAVATTGSYTDLTNKPTIPTGSYADLTNKPTLATVAGTGSYADLLNKPALATVATSGSYADLSNKPTIISLKGTSVTYPGNDLAADPAGSQQITITGTSFESTPTVYIGGTIAPAVTFVSSTQITVTTPAKAAGTYDIYIVNPGGATAIMVMGISYSGVPTWTTSAGSLGTLENNWTVQLQATSNSTVTYTLTSGSTLPSGVTLSSSGLITGTSISVEQTFNFSVTATDLENQDTPRSFSITITLGEPYFKYTTLLLTGNGAAPETKTYTVTNSGASDYLINGVSDPTITLVRGSTYIFNVSASGHPFWIKTAAVTGTASAYSTGVTNNGIESGTVTFIVPSDAPATLYYICQFHGSMVGTINVVAAATQNNTFKDSSINNITLTRNGIVSQGSFSPYGKNWSNYFDGSTDYLQIASNSAFALPGDFTLEMWMYPLNWAASNMLPYATYPGQAGGLMVGKIGSEFVVRASDTANQLTFPSFPATNQWTHVAVVRSGSTLSGYFNGARVATTTNTFSFTQSALSIGSEGQGSDYIGYLSNIRLVKGTAVYDPTLSSLTVPVVPLTAISGTSVLTCQSNRFKDNSTNNFTFTTTGTPTVQRLSPFNLEYEYSTAVYGGSAYFTPTNSSGLNAGTTLFNSMPSAFTMEAWVYPLSYGGSASQYQNRPIMAKGVVYMNFGLTSSGAVQLYHYEGNTQRTNASTTIVPLNAWSHIVASVSAGTITFYVNGQSSGTATWYGILGSDTPDYIGWHAENSGPQNFFDGYLSDVRYAKSVIYSSNFTPPAAPISAVSTTAFLLSGTNSAIFDSTMMNNLETAGNAQISTSVVKYGTGSMYFDGTGDGLVNVVTPNLVFGTADFTVEFWIYLSANLVNFAKIIQMGTTGDAFTIETQSTTNLLTVTNFTSTVYFSSSTALTTGSWIHVAATRASGTLRLFQNGTLVGSSANTVNFTSSGTGVYIGQSSLGTGMNGYLDDLRITKGYARYTANFTPPTVAFKAK